jgi:hypothetical protein
MLVSSRYRREPEHHERCGRQLCGGWGVVCRDAVATVDHDLRVALPGVGWWLVRPGCRASAVAFFAAMAETERENIREATLEGLNAAARKGNHGGRPPVITEDMLHTVLRRRARGESVEDIRPDLIIPTGKRKGRNPSLASIYRALAEHDKQQRYPEAVAQARADFTALQPDT